MTDLKQCATCKKNKTAAQFHKKKRAIDGLNSRCKKCENTAVNARQRTRAGLVTKIYGNQLNHSKTRGHIPPKYSRVDLQEWLFLQDRFHLMYDEWVKSGFVKKLTPSIDRLNDSRGYAFDNIQLVTWEDNYKKHKAQVVNGSAYKSKNKPVIQLSIDNVEVGEFYSITEAGRQTGISNISCVCNGSRKTAGGFKWKYAN